MMSRHALRRATLLTPIVRAVRQFVAAESLWHRALAIDSTISVLYYGLHNALVPQGKLTEGRRVLDIVRRRIPGDPLLLNILVQQAAAEQAWDEAERLALLNVTDKQGDTLQLVDPYEQIAAITMTRGRLAEAERHCRTQIALRR
jgi:predicted Zn-dependent protease